MSMIRCPRCKSETDASAAKPGSVIKCVHCRGDMRVPDVARTPASAAKQGGGRQSTLFRRMTNASVPGQRGRSSVPGGGRGAAETGGRDLSGLYLAGGGVALVAVIIGIAFAMKGGGSEPASRGGPRKEVARTQVQSPPPAPVPPPPPKEPAKPPEGAPITWEPDAASFVLESVRPIATDPTAEKDALNFIRTSNADRILTSPFRYMPFVVNSLISEDRDLVRASFQILFTFCDNRSILHSDGSNPIDIGKVNNAHYRGYIYQLMTEWWSRSAHKLPDAPGNQAAVDRTDWVALVRQLQGGAYHDETTPQGTAFLKVKNLGKAAWPRIAELIDHEELPLGRTAAQVLNELTREQKPLPTEQNRHEVKSAWMAWINQNK